MYLVFYSPSYQQDLEPTPNPKAPRWFNISGYYINVQKIPTPGKRHYMKIPISGGEQAEQEFSVFHLVHASIFSIKQRRVYMEDYIGVQDTVEKETHVESVLALSFKLDLVS